MQDKPTVADRLPTIPDRCISIHADVDGATFLQRVEKLLPEVSDWQFHSWEHDHFSPVPGKCLVLTYTSPDPVGQCATGLICRLFGNEQTHEVRLDIQATSWLNDQLDYDVYVAAAELFKSVLSSYNHRYGTRRRLRIPTKQSLEPKLPPIAQECFVRFLDRANRQVLNEFAWGALYAFILHVHSHNVRLSDSDFCRLLVLNGFDSDYARELAEFYKHARNLLYLARGYGTAAVYPHLCWYAWLEERKRRHVHKAGNAPSLGHG